MKSALHPMRRVYFTLSSTPTLTTKDSIVHKVCIINSSSAIVLTSRTFPSWDSAVLWGEGYTRRHPGTEWVGV